MATAWSPPNSPSATFNGGTITGPLVLDGTATPAATMLTVKGSYENQSVDFLTVVKTDAGGSTMCSVDDNGQANVFDRRAAKGGRVFMAANGGGTLNVSD